MVDDMLADAVRQLINAAVGHPTMIPQSPTSRLITSPHHWPSNLQTPALFNFFVINPSVESSKSLALNVGPTNLKIKDIYIAQSDHPRGGNSCTILCATETGWSQSNSDVTCTISVPVT